MGTTLRILLTRLNNAAAAASNYSRLFSSSAAPIKRSWINLSDDSEVSDGESSVYKRALKLKPPSTVKYNETLHNSVSLIGVIDLPFKEINTAGGGFGVHTFLRVKASTDTYRYFSRCGEIGLLSMDFISHILIRVMLKFWHEIAEMSVEHLKPNDFVYVSGLLGSYMKANEDGNLIRNHELISSFLSSVCTSVTNYPLVLSATHNSSIAKAHVLPFLVNKAIRTGYSFLFIFLISNNNPCLVQQIVSNKRRGTICVAIALPKEVLGDIILLIKNRRIFGMYFPPPPPSLKNKTKNLVKSVTVKEINFVAKDGLSPSFQKFIKFEAGVCKMMWEMTVSAEDIKQKRRDRLHLWQIFFSNPYEWWDNRKNKTKPNSPDFKHKDTGEILYLQENDPPWIKQQLQLQDSRLNGDSPREHKISQQLSSFDYDG
ncbi:hypothetical protein ACJIZ3_002591 [Penstemon smallii]|uniref:Uncharacterized protein n=1 Tax=Penstemon smallii TaxID=265156 RepID=A0ABD3U9N3_9LAMI